MNRILSLALVFILAATALFAEEAKETTPAPAAESSVELLPPDLPSDWQVGDDLPDFGIDFNAPVAAPTAPAKVDTDAKEEEKKADVEPTKEPEPAKAESPTETPQMTEDAGSPSMVATAMALATAAVTPEVAAAETVVPTPTETVAVPAPSPKPAVRAPVVPPASVPRGAVSVKDYFPSVPGQVMEYQFFTMPDQSVGRKSRIVECLKSQTFKNGTVRSTFKTTVFAGGTYKDEISVDNYSTYNNVVQLTAHNDQPLTERYLIKMPAPGATIRWVQKEPDGTEKQYKAYFEPLKTADRIYTDCLVVVEKHLKGAGELALRHFYYARGIGLVRLEVYGADLKVDRSSSIDLIPAK